MARVRMRQSHNPQSPVQSPNHQSSIRNAAAPTPTDPKLPIVVEVIVKHLGAERIDAVAVVQSNFVTLDPPAVT